MIGAGQTCLSIHPRPFPAGGFVISPPTAIRSTPPQPPRHTRPVTTTQADKHTGRRIRGIIAIVVGLVLAVAGFAGEAAGIGVLGLAMAVAGGVLWFVAAMKEPSSS